MRQRANLVRLSGQHIQRLQKALQLMNLKLTTVLQDVTGMTGLKIIRAILAGERDPQVLAALKLLHERKVAVFLPDGDGEVVPSPVDGIAYPIHPLQITAMGMLCADSLQFEELVQVCAEEGRWEFMVVLSPLRLPRATGSPFNPIAVF